MRDLRKTFRRRDRKAGRFARKRPWPALDDVTFTIDRGECVAILGQNGSGKSTLVRLLSTLLIDDGGEARIFGHDVDKEASTIRRLVNRVSVEASFFKKMSAAENLSYAARFYGMTPRQTRTAVPEILGRVGFPPERRGESMENLSRGMQQKVALARALLTSPVLLLLDEPTTGLDPRSKLEVQEFIRKVRREHDATILLCTHDMAEAETLADRIGILDRGRLLFLEPVEDVKRRFGVETLEEAFFAATGREFENEDAGRRRRVQGGVRMSEYAIEMRNQLVGLFGIVERNMYLTKRYFLWDIAFMFWTIANTLTIVFIARAAALTGHLSSDQENTLAITLLVGATIWAFLGIIFEFMTETVAWERWEGTIEYTFMAPLSRLVHLFGQGAFAVLYGLIRASILFFAVALFLGLHAPNANYGAAFALLALASISFIGVGIMTSVLPLISPEKGAQLGFVAQGLMLVVSGVYYPVSVMPEWMQWIAKISPATYALRGCRASIVDGAGLAVGERLAAADHRGARDADRPGDLQGRRAVREEAREAEAVGMTDWFAGDVAERYDESTAGKPVEPVVDFLEPLAARRSARARDRHRQDRGAARRAGHPGRGHRPLAGHGRAAAEEDGRDPGRDRGHVDDEGRRDVLARLHRLQLDQQRHDAGRAGGRVRERRGASRAGRVLRRRGRRPEHAARSRCSTSATRTSASTSSTSTRSGSSPTTSRSSTASGGDCPCRSAQSRRRSST